jgi:excisionase family DNA binding protein
MHASTISRMEVTPILVSVPQASQMLGRGVSTIYDLIGGGHIRAVKSDGRTLVVVESLREYADKLPAAIVAPPRKRKPQHMRLESNA